MNCFPRRFFKDFEWIWEGFGEGLGGLVGNFLRLFSNIIRHVNDFDEKLDFGGILEGSGKGLGRVLGGIWEGLGAFWALLGAVYILFS